MVSVIERRIAGIVLIITPIAFLACFTLLGSMFAYPDILRQPTADVLTRFAAAGSPLIGVWYLLTLTALLFVPSVVLLHRVLAPQLGGNLLTMATVLGILAGVTQTLGFIRWPFLVPFLAQVFGDPMASDAEREAAALIFEAFHRYAGMAVGEHLGYLLTSGWTLLVGLTMVRSALFGRWLGWAAVVLAMGIAAGLLEPAGWAAGGAINAAAYLLWAVWLVVVGALLLVRARHDAAGHSAGRSATTVVVLDTPAS